jgi:hypothetical protein
MPGMLRVCRFHPPTATAKAEEKDCDEINVQYGVYHVNAKVIESLSFPEISYLLRIREI